MTRYPEEKLLLFAQRVWNRCCTLVECWVTVGSVVRRYSVTVTASRPSAGKEVYTVGHG